MIYSLNKNIHFSTYFLIFPVVLLCIFQFFTISLSTTDISFTANVLLSFFLAAGLAHAISLEFSRKMSCSVHQLTLILTISASMAFLMLLKVNSGIPDVYCPTGILGLVTQVAEGHFPVSFQSFPEFTMNYHQGFVLIAGLLVLLFKLPVVVVLKMLFAALYFLICIGVMLFLLKNKNPYYFLPPFLFLFIASGGGLLFSYFGLTELTQLSVFEFSSNNSWPLALLLINAGFFIFNEFKNRPLQIIYAALLLLSLSTINALAFQTILYSFSISISLYVAYLIIKGQSLTGKNLLLTYLLIVLISLIPKFIPSAFMIGALYSSPEIATRFLSPETGSYLNDIVRYVILLNPFALFALVSLTFTVRKNSLFESLLFIILAFSVIFPVVFKFSNIIDWDMLQKFSFLSMFFAAIVVTIQMANYPKYKFIFVFCMFVSVAFGSQTIHELFTFRTSMDFTSAIEPDEDARDVVGYLSKNRTVLIPFMYRNTILPWDKKQVVHCNPDINYSAVAQYSGNYIRYTYDTNFLLNERFEQVYFKNSLWNDLELKSKDVATEMQSGATLIVDKKLLDPITQKKLEGVLQAEKIEFERYILYQK